MRPTRSVLRLVVPALLVAACAGHEPPPAKATADVVAEKPSTSDWKVVGGIDAPPPSTLFPSEYVPPADKGDGAYPGFHVPAFKTTVRRPSAQGATSEPFDSRTTKSATLYVINSTTCPYCALYVERMKALEATYMPRGVDVVHVYPNRSEPADEKVAWHAKQAFRGGQILDADASIARALEADHTPTVYLVSDKGVIVYRGAIDDHAYQKEGVAPERWASNAIAAHLGGLPIAPDTTDPEG
jgi:hypothetical protein